MASVRVETHPPVRLMLLGILIIGLLGSAADLLFLGHYEDKMQFVPFGLIAASLPVIVWDAAARTSTSARAMRLMMAALVVSGLVGIALHYLGSVEFQKEVDPAIRGFELFMKVMESKAPPTIAPAILAHLGLVGLVYTYCKTERR